MASEIEHVGYRLKKSVKSDSGEQRGERSKEEYSRHRSIGKKKLFVLEEAGYGNGGSDIRLKKGPNLGSPGHSGGRKNRERAGLGLWGSDTQAPEKLKEDRQVPLQREEIT